jgi:hypothetical protein
MEKIPIIHYQDKYRKKEVSKKKYEEAETGLDRRTFLKGLGALAAVGAFYAGFSKGRQMEREESPENVKTTESNQPLNDETTPEQPVPYEPEMYVSPEVFEEDAKTIREFVRWEGGKKIELDEKTPHQVEAYWKKKYKEDPKLRKSLIDGYREMGAWLPHIEKIFEEEGVPTKYAYLAIAESHFIVKKPSPKGAVGQYQFMKRTALGKVARLRISGDFDERKDPLKSAAACARILKHDYALIGDWDLTISCYNGHFAWDYIKLAKKQGQKPTYDGFVEYIETDINHTIDNLEAGQAYTVRKKDSLRLIALRFNHQGYKVTVDSLASHNQLGPAAILKEGQKLYIPLTDNEKEAKFNDKVKGYIENLNYPPKFKAINSLIEEGFVSEKKRQLKFRPYTVRHAVEKETKKKLIGFRRNKAPTLKSIAKETGQPLEELVYLNPAFHAKTSIPDGYIIRMPIG